SSDDVDLQQPIADEQRRGDARLDRLLVLAADDEAIDDGLHLRSDGRAVARLRGACVIFPTLGFSTVRQVDGLPVDEDPPAALLPHFGKEDVEILAVDRKDGGAKLDLRAIRKGEDRFENLTGGTAGGPLPGKEGVRVPARRVRTI